ncbi:Mitochondrial transcription termination factor family protein [Striga hermonthica]|uniref:Mitochondrial transcription termination factor family protein n=1 Tax=Striga hermonthica TaxID=68872 RepID=A0A9N7R5X7_STRHE|nr:Mitochondrial transcription termination factor family protein [Striga hermonthica]
MLLRRTTIAAAAAVLFRSSTLHFSTAAATTTAKKLFSKIPWRHRPKAIHESQKALTDYLHSTRSLPFFYADKIARNSPQSLSNIVSGIAFSLPTFASSFQRFLRYHPINELDFFLESIGLNCCEDQSGRPVFPPNTFSLSDCRYYDAACALASMGFPWSKLGLLCADGFSIFESNPLDLKRRIGEIKDVYGFNTVTVISICLAFPRVLYNNSEKMGVLLSDLKVLFLDYDLLGCVEGGDVESVFDVCEKIKYFYDPDREMGGMGELMGRNKSVLIEYPREVLVSKIEFFRKLDIQNDEICNFLLSKPEIFDVDLETQVVSVSGFLKQLGLSEDELESLKQKYPHVFGRNRLANLPNAMRSMNLEKWFFQRLKNDNHNLLANYTICCSEDVDRQYEEYLRKILAKRTHVHTIKKLNFLHGIGFGENKYAAEALGSLFSNGDQLQSRFDCLINCGVEYSRLCTIIRWMPKILNQQENKLVKKIEYLCNDLGLSLEYLDIFPGYMRFDLEKRIKPRCKFHKWLMERGLCKKKYALATIIACSEKAYVAHLSRISPDAVRVWEEGREDWASG